MERAEVLQQKINLFHKHLDELKTLLRAHNQVIADFNQERRNVLSKVSKADLIKRNMHLLKYNRQLIDLNINFRFERYLLEISQVEEFRLLESNRKDLVITD